MTIDVKKEDNKLFVELEGRLDTNTSPELERAVGDSLENIESLVLDFEKLRYISSSGLRVLLMFQKKMNSQNASMVIRHVNDLIMEVFDATGFADILTIEN